MSRKAKRWWPGIYEGLTAQQAKHQVGQTQYESKFPGQGSTPKSMRGIHELRVACRKDGTVCRSLNGILK